MPYFTENFFMDSTSVYRYSMEKAAECFDQISRDKIDTTVARCRTDKARGCGLDFSAAIGVVPESCANPEFREARNAHIDLAEVIVAPGCRGGVVSEQVLRLQI